MKALCTAARRLRQVFAISSIVLASAFFADSNATAQGTIHFGTGDSYLFSQPTLTGGQINEGATFVTFRVSFNDDLFNPGESLQIDLLSTPTSLTPLATGIVSNSASITLTATGYDWPGQDWNAQNGAVRLTVLFGSVGVSGATATTASLSTSERFYSYTIPEPSSGSLILFGSAAFGAVRWFKRRRSLSKG